MPFIVLPVPVVENDTDGIDEEESAQYEQDEGGMPLYVGDDQGENGGNVYPYKGQEKGLTDGDLL